MSLENTVKQRGGGSQFKQKRQFARAMMQEKTNPTWEAVSGQQGGERQGRGQSPDDIMRLGQQSSGRGIIWGTDRFQCARHKEIRI